MLRARITQVRGKDVTLENLEEVRGRGSLAREYTVTYRPSIEANERVVAGRFWDATPSSRPEISIEEGIRERFKIDIGDHVRFDVLGQPIVARVTSVRQVNWRDSRAGGFMFVFRPGVLDAAPHGFISPVRGPADLEARARMQRDLVAAFPECVRDRYPRTARHRPGRRRERHARYLGRRRRWCSSRACSSSSVPSR